MTLLRWLKSFILLALLAVVTAVCLPYPGTGDVRYFWLPWMQTLADKGWVAGFAANQADYPPLSSGILLTAVRLAPAFAADHFTALKWSLLLFLLSTTLVWGLWTRNLLLTAVFHLSLLLSSLALGYIDIYFAPFLLIALWAWQKERLALASLFFGLACLTKWQPLIIAPFLWIYVWRKPTAVAWPRRLLLITAPALLLVVVIVAWFGRPLLDSLRAALDHHYLSGNAFNLGWIITYWLHRVHPEQFGGLVNGQATYITTTDWHYTLWPKLLFFFFYGLTLLLALQKTPTFTNLLRLALLGYLAYFVFNTGVHENHLFLAMILAMLLAWQDPNERATAVAITLFFHLNLFLFYGLDGGDYRFGRLMAGMDAGVLLGATAVLFFLTYFADTAFHKKEAGN